MRGVAEFEHGIADDIGGGFGAEHLGVSGGRDDGELFEQIPRQVIAVDFLPREIIEDHGIEVRHHEWRCVRIGHPTRAFSWEQHGQCMARANARNDRGDRGSRVRDRGDVLQGQAPSRSARPIRYRPT